MGITIHKNVICHGKLLVLWLQMQLAITRKSGSRVRYPVWQHTFVSPSAFSRRAVVSYWRKYVHEVLVNRLGGLSLPRKSVVRLTDRPDITLDVYRGRKTTIQQQHLSPSCIKLYYFAPNISTSSIINPLHANHDCSRRHL